ncbi:MAG: hypothetical protein GY711_07795 [bacterium]|nr:hypothetical protein [bacterium]
MDDDSLRLWSAGRRLRRELESGRVPVADDFLARMLALLLEESALGDRRALASLERLIGTVEAHIAHSSTCALREVPDVIDETTDQRDESPRTVSPDPAT